MNLFDDALKEIQTKLEQYNKGLINLKEIEVLSQVQKEIVSKITTSTAITLMYLDKYFENKVEGK